MRHNAIRWVNTRRPVVKCPKDRGCKRGSARCIGTQAEGQSHPIPQVFTPNARNRIEVIPRGERRRRNAAEEELCRSRAPPPASLFDWFSVHPSVKKLPPLRSRQGPCFSCSSKALVLAGTISTESGLWREYAVQKVLHGGIKHYFSGGAWYLST